MKLIFNGNYSQSITQIHMFQITCLCMFYLDEYPLIVGCSTTGGPTERNTIKAFMRFCPAGVTVDHVSYFKQLEKQCLWHVDYNFRKNVEIHDINELPRIMKELFDVVKLQISVTNDSLVKIMNNVSSCRCYVRPI